MGKKCFKCGETKSLSEFYKHKMMADGHLNKCKECQKKDVRENRLLKIEYYTEYEKKRAMLPHRVEARADYAKTEAGKVSIKRSSVRWRKNNPVKRLANNAVNNAIRGGLLHKPNSCECCGNSSNIIHGHHDDYAYPLNVRWLCPACHMRWHRSNGPGKNAS